MAERFKREESPFIERVVHISRVSKVVKGGRRFRFSALVVVGDGKGRVGVGLGKAGEVPDAIKKGMERAKRSMFSIPMLGDTIPHDVIGHYGAGEVLMKPASEGTGVIAGNSVRAVCDAAGIKDILSKSIGSDNVINVVKACIDGLKKLKSAKTEEGNKQEDTKVEIYETDGTKITKRR